LGLLREKSPGDSSSKMVRSAPKPDQAKKSRLGAIAGPTSSYSTIVQVEIHVEDNKRRGIIQNLCLTAGG